MTDNFQCFKKVVMRLTVIHGQLECVFVYFNADLILHAVVCWKDFTPDYVAMTSDVVSLCFWPQRI